MHASPVCVASSTHTFKTEPSSPSTASTSQAELSYSLWVYCRFATFVGLVDSTQNVRVGCTLVMCSSRPLPLLQTAATAVTAVEAEESLATTAFEGGLPPPPDERPDQDAYLAPPETNLGDDVGSILSGGAVSSDTICSQPSSAS